MMRKIQATVLLLATFALVPFLQASQAFNNAPARPATAAAQLAREKSESQHERAATDNAEGKVAKVLESARNNEGALYALLRQMPKGGDLHNHITGAVYAESWVRFAIDNNLCVDRTTLALSQPPCLNAQLPVADARRDAALYAAMIDNWSMRSIHRQNGPAHDHFFNTFGKFGAAAAGHMGEILAEVTARAAEGNVEYLELMTSPDEGAALALGAKVGWDADLEVLRHKLLDAGLPAIVAASRKNMDAWEQRRNELQKCGERAPGARRAGCEVDVRQIYTVLRAFPPEQVFAQLLLGFELSAADGRVVGINMVQPEDGPIAMDDYRLHMRMVGFLHEVYPKVHISLHAGELAPGLVPPEGLRFHIREAVEKGHAQRIGHGVDVMYEDNPEELLEEMAHNDVLVEICLTSNEGILGVRGHAHPLASYLKGGVPVALATDDEGVSRSEMTREYEKAVTEQGADYATLKRMARNSLEYSFLAGRSLWADRKHFVMARECEGHESSQPCQKLLSASDKAREQMRFEKALTEFENKVAKDKE